MTYVVYDTSNLIDWSNHHDKIMNSSNQNKILDLLHFSWSHSSFQGHKIC